MVNNSAIYSKCPVEAPIAATDGGYDCNCCEGVGRSIGNACIAASNKCRSAWEFITGPDGGYEALAADEEDEDHLELGAADMGNLAPVEEYHDRKHPDRKVPPAGRSRLLDTVPRKNRG
eukprot:CAMPEP_0167754096 /NCGR_PEP_ID=MMETSP0110_2-20121227/8081_1 /TAXON_ID=629695 /ORGANISM="Gymnochlora sp., Strain CCMP2014" /LENGTH=118 /DNA_ID=CAMNT_0007639939 /DNA_START=674 /DNA_END=1031 /DNA_ORIENTATION=+